MNQFFPKQKCFRSNSNFFLRVLLVASVFHRFVLVFAWFIWLPVLLCALACEIPKLIPKPGPKPDRTQVTKPNPNRRPDYVPNQVPTRSTSLQARSTNLHPKPGTVTGYVGSWFSRRPSTTTTEQQQKQQQ